MPRTETAADVAAAITDADSVFIATHEYPDGDAVGSLLALRSLLLSLGKSVHAATPTPPPDRFAYMAGFDAISTAPPPEPADVGIALDCDGADRLGELEDALLASGTVVDIDHHGGPDAFGDIRLVDPSAAATAVLVMDVARELGQTPPTADQAGALYSALIADTGCFRFTNTSPGALRLGADLIAAGADPAELARRVFTIRPMEAVRLEARALLSLELAEPGVAIAALSREDFTQTGASSDLTEGIIDTFRDAIGVRAAALIKETEPHVWQVSLRGNAVDVASVARRFDGGGHMFAAGCTIEGDRDEVAGRLVRALRTAVEEAPDA
ncbi:MAG: DHH family phosphoesterase [Armatimonadota bacterium]|jgi:phosphoesterase RecJ-like protein